MFVQLIQCYLIHCNQPTIYNPSPSCATLLLLLTGTLNNTAWEIRLLTWRQGERGKRQRQDHATRFEVATTASFAARRIRNLRLASLIRNCSSHTGTRHLTRNIEKKRLLTASCLSVCMEQLGSNWTDFH
jgi:hypothetical protein